MGEALPNLHPAVVHLPLALLPAAVLFDLLALLRPTWTWLERGATLLFVLAALGAGAAFLAGQKAEDQIGPQPAAIHELIEQHEELARLALIATAGLALARLALSWRDRDRPRIGAIPARFVLLLAGAGAVFLLLTAADRGGSLVYQHGVAVRTTAAP